MSAASPKSRPYLGVGWRFPLQVTPAGKIASSGYERRIEEAIYLILGTAKGERVTVPEFGCGIHDLVFAPNNPSTLSLVIQSVRDALTRFEKRIDLLSVDVETSPEQPNLILIRINYRIRANNSIGNLVYPFYINEGG